MKDNLEALIRDMVARGEMTHLSLSPYEKQWAVSFCAASPINGYTFVLDKDPINALCRAITETKLKTRKRKAPDTPEQADDGDSRGAGQSESQTPA
jgi:hypothetical protein